MDKRDAERFEKTLNTILETKGRKPVSGQALALWWVALKQYSLAEVNKALAEAMMSQEYFEPGLVGKFLTKNKTSKQYNALGYEINEAGKIVDDRYLLENHVG